MTRPLLLSLIVLALGASAVLAQTPAPPPAPAPTPTVGTGSVEVKSRGTTRTIRIGVADEKPDMFFDLRFLALGIKTARRSVAWDTFRRGNGGQLAEIDEWMNAAQAAGVSPIISFNRSRVKPHAVPTRAQWLAAFKAFRKRYPTVRDFAATNESNHNPPTASRPKLAAQYYLDMRRACPTCRIAAATINERPQKKFMATWIRAFRKALHGHRPKYWAMHNYYGANTFSLKGTKIILRETKSGEMWITEVGGLVKRRSSFEGKLEMREGLAHSTLVWRYIFDRILPLDPRIRRAYLYHWNSASRKDTWDSGLIDYRGKARAGLRVVQQRLR